MEDIALGIRIGLDLSGDSEHLEELLEIPGKGEGEREQEIKQEREGAEEEEKGGQVGEEGFRPDQWRLWLPKCH